MPPGIPWPARSGRSPLLVHGGGGRGDGSGRLQARAAPLAAGRRLLQAACCTRHCKPPSGTQPAPGPSPPGPTRVEVGLVGDGAHVEDGRQVEGRLVRNRGDAAVACGTRTQHGAGGALRLAPRLHCCCSCNSAQFRPAFPRRHAPPASSQPTAPASLGCTAASNCAVPLYVHQSLQRAPSRFLANRSGESKVPSSLRLNRKKSAGRGGEGKMGGVGWGGQRSPCAQHGASTGGKLRLMPQLQPMRRALWGL